LYSSAPKSQTNPLSCRNYCCVYKVVNCITEKVYSIFRLSKATHANLWRSANTHLPALPDRQYTVNNCLLSPGRAYKARLSRRLLGCSIVIRPLSLPSSDASPSVRLRLYTDLVACLYSSSVAATTGVKLVRSLAADNAVGPFLQIKTTQSIPPSR